MIEQKAEIIFNRKVASDTFLMGLRASDIVAEAAPGQFVMIRVSPELDPILRRPFSICGTQEGDMLLVLYRVIGKGTRILAGVGQGETLSVLGPLGTGFKFPEKGQKAILVSGGIGIAPLIFLAQKMKDREMKFLSGYRSVKEMVPIEWAGLSGINDSISTDDGTMGHKGPVTDLFEAAIDEFRGGAFVFSCGPLPMLKKVAEITLERGISCQVSVETHMACGLGACQGCAVKSSFHEDRTYFHVCQDGPVFDARSLDW
ncbi:MAG TPA: dihydroorotate dehydrogenase electron transfer subunit [Desulfobacteraceae bacterium]|nr:dihydroorotate dehydrogenase electron transfer subunit [Desulfobacteraceae bacterium]HPJ67384.1 dihydroorotate dehydrogenase electron transfer subunit [Desulfobacteraceae bacterium]HPQ29679.1 dihydroorotate dehydrogenase electron transfer subunit [Desulfobacteraceae bacterium]